MPVFYEYKKYNYENTDINAAGTFALLFCIRANRKYGGQKNAEADA